MKKAMAAIIMLAFLCISCATTVSVYKGDPETTPPVLVVVGVPEDGDLTYEEAADGKVTLTIKQKKEGFNPFGKIWDLAKAITGKVVETVQVPLGGD